MLLRHCRDNHMMIEYALPMEAIAHWIPILSWHWPTSPRTWSTTMEWWVSHWTIPALNSHISQLFTKPMSSNKEYSGSSSLILPPVSPLLSLWVAMTILLSLPRSSGMIYIGILKLGLFPWLMPSTGTPLFSVLQLLKLFTLQPLIPLYPQSKFLLLLGMS